EAEAGMLGQPVYFLTPDVAGVHLTGALREGVTATDLALTITQLLRKAKVVGKFVEFFGPGAKALPVVDRATIANMAPEYGATMGFFPIDEETIAYMRGTGRSDELCAAFEGYYKAQGLWGIPSKGDLNYSVDLDLDLGIVQPGVAGPKRPQDRINLPDLGDTFRLLLTKTVADGGYGKSSGDLAKGVAVRINGSSHGEAPELFSTEAKRPEQHMTEGAPKNVAEMVTNRPAPNPENDLPDTSYRC